jgi:hypothetical protein
MLNAYFVPSNVSSITARISLLPILLAGSLFPAAAQAAPTAPSSDSLLAGPDIRFTWSTATGTVSGYSL